jgi:hypothetical protein
MSKMNSVYNTASNQETNIVVYVALIGELTGGWRKLHNEELHNLYSSPSIIRMIKLRRMRWAGHIARMGRRGMHIGYWWEFQKDH